MKKVILMRHAKADDYFEGSDLSRPLTAEGQKEHDQMAMYLKPQLEKVDAILFSPFLRAEQSAQIVSQKLPKVPLVKEPALGTVFDSYTILKHIDEKHFENVVIVGHAPTLSAFGCSLLEKPEPLKFDKSGGVVLFFDDQIEFGKGQIESSFSPKRLK